MLLRRYRVDEFLGRGGMAEVYRAKRTGVEGFEKVLAVKRILKHLTDSPEFVEMFVNEAKMVADLVERAFGGSPGPLVAHALEQTDPSPKELDELRRLIDQHRSRMEEKPCSQPG